MRNYTINSETFNLVWSLARDKVANGREQASELGADALKLFDVVSKMYRNRGVISEMVA